MFGVVLFGSSWVKKVAFQRRFPVVNVVYELLYFVGWPRRGLRWTPSRCEDVSLACGAFPLGRGENKITGIILTLMNVQICLHRYTLSRSFSPSSSSLRSLVDDTQHTTHKSLLFSAFISRSFIFVSVPNPHQMCTSDGHAASACLRRYFGCLLNAGNKHGHAKKTHKSKHNMPLLVDAAASITAGFCQSHFLCDL